MPQVATASEVLIKVMNEVTGVGKNNVNEQQGFKFRGIDAVVNAVGPALRKHGGFMIPNLQSVEYDTAATRSGGTMNIARVRVEYAIFGTEGEPIAGVVAAEAFDSGDKATAKAMSVAYRTFILQALCLPTDEPDPDSFSYEAAPASVKKSVADWKAQISTLTTVDDARTLWKEAANAKAAKSVTDAIEAKVAELS